jgi:hypothetical protein
MMPVEDGVVQKGDEDSVRAMDEYCGMWKGWVESDEEMMARSRNE